MAGQLAAYGYTITGRVHGYLSSSTSCSPLVVVGVGPVICHSALQLLLFTPPPPHIALFSPLETISTSLWASLHHRFPVLSVFSHVSCQFIFFHILPGVVDPSLSRPPRSSLPRYNHVHHFSSEVVFSPPPLPPPCSLLLAYSLHLSSSSCFLVCLFRQSSHFRNLLVSFSEIFSAISRLSL